MGNLLDTILGRFNSGQSGGFIPGSLLRDAPGSGYLPEDQVSTPPTDPYGNRIGGPAPGVPLPRPRPPEAGPAAFSPQDSMPRRLMQPDIPSGESSETGFGSGGLAAALGLDPERAKTVMASLAGGLSNVKNSPFAGQVAANAAGGAIAGGNKAEDTAIEQAIKLPRANLRGRYRGDITGAKFGQQNAKATAAIPRTESLVIDEETRRAAQADREGTLTQARDALARGPGARAAIIDRLRELGIAF